ncbi:serine hydrolase domain-containing protein [Limnoglobus roseus]|nr:serine hydrolase [Limnoglobus roseus]
MKRLLMALVVVLAYLGVTIPARGEGFDWQTASPESQGFSKEKLDALVKVVVAKKSRAFLVVRNDRVVSEWYADGNGPTKAQGTASLAKAIVGGLPLAVALTDGRLTLDDPAAKYVRAWKDDARKSKITLRHLGSHTSGLEDAEADDLPHDKLTGWKGDFWKSREPPDDPFTLARDKAAAVTVPGEQLRYSNPGIGILTYCVTASIQGTQHTDARTLLRERVLKPIGVGDKEWSAGYGKAVSVDGLSLVPAWGGGAFTPRAMARIGRLVVRAGDWDGKRILSKEAVAAVTGDAGLPGHCGMGWWTNAGGRYAGLPKDAVWGAGAGDQLLLVVPSLNLVMVRNGQAMEPGPGEPPVRKDDVFTRYHDYRARTLFEPLVAAIATGKPDGPAAVEPPPPAR